MTTRLTDPYIYIQDNVLSEKQCKSIIRRFNKDKRSVQGITSGGVMIDIKNSHDLLITELNDWKDIDDLFFNKVNNLFVDYGQHLIDAGGTFTSFSTGERIVINPIATASPIEDIGYQIQKTKPGKGYVWHHDYCTKRLVTFILYLNTVDEGWTQFYNGDQVAPVAGRGCLFPATWTYYHQGYPPKQTKYIMTGWLREKQDSETIVTKQRK